jgi:glycosyltransferase involved in cell wall biosynthesis
MPLADNTFNRAKSDLKFIEAGGCRVAALASPTVYAQTLIDGETGLLFSTPAELHSRLLRLVAVPEDGRAMGDAAREYVSRHRMLAQQVQPRIDFYRALWAVRHELTEALYQRVPQLRPAGEFAAAEPALAEVEASEINLFA